MPASRTLEGYVGGRSREPKYARAQTAGIVLDAVIPHRQKMSETYKARGSANPDFGRRWTQEGELLDLDRVLDQLAAAGR